jgi:hypothetical protein
VFPLIKQSASAALLAVLRPEVNSGGPVIHIVMQTPL